MKIGFHYGAYRYVRMRWTAKRLAEVVALPGSCLTPLESDNEPHVGRNVREREESLQEIEREGYRRPEHERR